VARQQPPQQQEGPRRQGAEGFWLGPAAADHHLVLTCLFGTSRIISWLVAELNLQRDKERRKYSLTLPADFARPGLRLARILRSGYGGTFGIMQPGTGTPKGVVISMTVHRNSKERTEPSGSVILLLLKASCQEE